MLISCVYYSYIRIYDVKVDMENIHHCSHMSSSDDIVWCIWLHQQAVSNKPHNLRNDFYPYKRSKVTTIPVNVDVAQQYLDQSYQPIIEPIGEQHLTAPLPVLNQPNFAALPDQWMITISNKTSVSE
jgi:hypothetical protein